MKVNGWVLGGKKVRGGGGEKGKTKKGKIMPFPHDAEYEGRRKANIE